MLECPKGHKLPYKSKRGNCTPLYCSEQRIDPRKNDAEKRGLMKVEKEDAKKRGERVKTAQREEVERGMKQMARRDVRKGLLEPTPADLAGEAAETYVTDKLVRLLPDAVAELEFQLKFGDDKQRMEAARDVLDANGMRKRDAVTAGGQTIVLNVNGPLPWAISGTPATIEGKVTDAKIQLGEASGSKAGVLPKG
jgi:hypothetical protein